MQEGVDIPWKFWVPKSEGMQVERATLWNATGLVVQDSKWGLDPVHVRVPFQPGRCRPIRSVQSSSRIQCWSDLPYVVPTGSSVCFEGTTAQIGCAGELAAQGQGSWVMFKCCDVGPRGLEKRRAHISSSHTAVLTKQQTAFVPVFYPGGMTFRREGEW